MSRPSLTIVKESLPELKKLKSSQKQLKLEKRVECLILLKEGRFVSQKETAAYLGISLKTIDRWLRVYRQKGIDELIAPVKRDKPSKIFTEEIHNGLEAKLQDSRDPLLSYTHAQQWIRENYGVEVGYQWLWTYLKKNFKTKLKVPRKSHVNKDDQAADAFFKTALQLPED